jgi:hypothetical protein
VDNGYFEPGMAGVIDRLTQAGYGDTFKGELGGVHALRSGHIHRPEDLQVDSIDRFEGISDPDDQAIVLAIDCPSDGCRGTYAVPYGNNMSAVDGALIARIPDARKRSPEASWRD